MVNGLCNAQRVGIERLSIEHLSIVVINARGRAASRGGHPWIYRADVVDVDAAGGDIVQVVGPRKRTIGQALFSDRSQIPIRMLTLGDAPRRRDTAETRLQRAIQFRESLQLDATAYRLVHGEADLLPSLIVDRYGDYLVVQALSQGMDRLLPTITAPAAGAAGARRHPRAQRSQGPRARRARADDRRIWPARFPTRCRARRADRIPGRSPRGQKTGLFLDQRENREAAARYARGRLLDAFSYHGGFALRLARQCTDADAYDISADAVRAFRSTRHATACRT